jgi:hypothetical protein
MSLSIDQAFQILEVPSTATWEEVRQAYREMVKVWHPDRFQADAKFQARATKKAQDINLAYQVLEKHFQSPPTSTQKAEEMFEQWTEDSQRSTHQPNPKPPGQPFANFATLDDMMGYFSLGLQYRVYPCHIRRSNQTELTPERISRISINVLIVISLLSIVLKLPPNLFFVCAIIAGTLKSVELYGKHSEPPDALILTELAVSMIEGIKVNNGQCTATICHTFLYEHIENLQWDGEVISFQTISGIKFGFHPTRKEALTAPDTRYFKSDVFSASQVIAQFQSRK